MPSRLAVALLGISLVGGSGNCQPPTAAGSERFEIRGTDGEVVIAADDVLACEWASHTLTLKPERAEKAESCMDRNTNAASNAGLKQEPPSGSRTSAWAEASHGLQCRATSPAEIEQGMPLEVTVEFRADSETDEPRARRLNAFLLPAFLELWLVDPQTSRRFVVRPYDPTAGMPVWDAGENAVPLDGGSLKSWRVSFPLARLYDELRPGRYACRVQYSFPKTPTRFWTGGEEEWRKASFWNGTVVSGQFGLKLKRETPKTITLLLPKRLGVVKKLVQLRMDDDKKSAVPVIRFRSRDAEKVTLPARNGHFVMAQYYRDGKLKGLGAPPKLVDDVYDVDTWYDYQGGDKKTSYTIEVFETRDRPGHEWSPNRKSGGYKVLWKKTFVVSVSENGFRELQPNTSGFPPVKQREGPLRY